MRAVVIEEPGALEVREVPDPVARAGEVVVAVRACGICGTDLHVAAGEFGPTRYPITPGHEFAGVIAEVGPGVSGDWVDGERVAVDPSLFCGRCPACREGRGNLCADWNAIGVTAAGAFADYVAVPAANLYRLGEGQTFNEGALIEPLSCAVHGLRRLGPVLGESVLIVGAGTMGLLLGQLILDAGAARLTVVDSAPARCDIARALGAGRTATSVAELAGERFGIAVDATGVPAAIEAAFGAVDRGGRLLVFGVAPVQADVRLSPFRIYNDEITIVGSMAVLHSYQAATRLLESGAVRTAEILTHHVPLAEFAEALELVRTGSGVKVQVEPAGAAARQAAR